VGRIGVFCGASFGNRPEYDRAARALGQEMVARGLGLVFGGGGVGLMGAVADAVLDAGGEVTGVIPHGLVVRELAHPRVADMRVVNTMHARKALMADLSDAFVALPGGFGTLDELFEAATWSQLGIQRKPIGLLNVAGYFDGLLAQVRHAVAEGFVPRRNETLLLNAEDPASLLDRLLAFDLPPAPAWVVAR
jgi:uncharacterized protein (TIGR00730 family)